MLTTSLPNPDRLPEKVYVDLLALLGVTRRPPAAAAADLVFTRVGTGDERVTIPAGTRVGAAGGREPVVFATAAPATIEPGQTAVTVRAWHGVPVDGDLVGEGTGVPGQVLRAAGAPIVRTYAPDDVLLGVAVPPAAVRGPAVREFRGVTYELWRPVETFTGTGREYLLDRVAGTVTFAPAADAVPPARAQIRMWYWTGGGLAGNIAANTLTALRDRIPGVRVTNPAPARGGQGLESVAAALSRAPYESFAPRRAVSARDFRALAARLDGIGRADACSAGQPGRIEAVLVPDVAPQDRPGWRLPVEVLTGRETDDVLEAARRDLDGRRSLATSLHTGWARYKPVSVRGRVVVAAGEDPDAVRARVHEHLFQAISPLPTLGSPDGWPLGEPLRASAVAGVVAEAAPVGSRVEELRFVVLDAPDGRIRTLAGCPAEPGAWFTGSGEVVFRSTNGGSGWEAVGRFSGEEVRRVVPAADRSVAVVTVTGDLHARVYLSADLGERWTKPVELEAAVTAAAWVDRGAAAVLLLATDTGLYELSPQPGAVPVQVLVDPADADRGFNAISAFVSAGGVTGVAVAAQARQGVYLSTAGGRAGTFTPVGLSNVDVRTLAVQQDGAATVLWAGVAEADPRRPGVGAQRARLFEAAVTWQAVSSGWSGGSCWDLAFDGPTVLAASQNAGVLRLETGAASPSWRSPEITCGLPLRDRTRFAPVEAVTVSAGEVLAGTGFGVHLRTGADRWVSVASRENRETVTIPPTWLLCSGEHDVTVVRDTA
ncbi:putative baseplate assembly protein [Dactylosporangium siamense]|uniref:Baseplate protein J-like domain-containing protein n=1 Tax=Dactylosporangium siamense TaxID=685454 RepID=A0A919PJA6_9ACTN|nr:hypothetical protein Dsi01nite_030100 [Dactylosporangium siamense]